MGPWRILLVDDDPDYGEMIRTALRRAGLDVVFHVDASQALAAFLGHPGGWDALITDQTMPSMTGFELVRAAKAVNPNLPCILSTGDVLAFDQTLRAAGVSAVLRKPVKADQIIDTLSHIIDRAK